MIVYHGSKSIISNPAVKGSNPTNDYGPAFYLTEDLNAAKSWACRNNSLGIVNKYYVNSERYSKLRILDLTKKDVYGVLNWIAILLHFRQLDFSFRKNNELTLAWIEKYYIDVSEYDAIKGFRADDSYFRFPLKFLSNDLAFEDLQEIFLSGNLGIQLAFMSEKAIKLLQYVDAIECEDSFLGHYYSIISEATTYFNEVISLPRDPNKTYILDLMRKDNE